MRLTALATLMGVALSTITAPAMAAWHGFISQRGFLWYDETGAVCSLAALPIPAERIVDTSGAGDVFHGAYVYSHLVNPYASWDEHFRFARSAAAHKVQHLGNEAGLPTLADIQAIRSQFGDP